MENKSDGNILWDVSLIRFQYQCRIKHAWSKGNLVIARLRDIYLILAQNISLSTLLSLSRFWQEILLLLLSSFTPSSILLVIQEFDFIFIHTWAKILQDHSEEWKLGLDCYHYSFFSPREPQEVRVLVMLEVEAWFCAWCGSSWSRNKEKHGRSGIDELKPWICVEPRARVLAFLSLGLGGFGNQVQTLEVSSIDRLPTFGVV
jgi:hypothetical protein